jgi:16S rRNA (guanine527-N7)-methyltransferase
MTEEEARAATGAIIGDEALARLDRFAQRVIAESEKQNLVAKPTLAALWSRHLLDSAQLLPLAQSADGLWVDIGTGAGFPGMVVALATNRPVFLVEPRRMRADFLQQVVDDQAIGGRVTVARIKIERLANVTASVISARAVASVTSLLDATAQIADRATVYLLPKGQSATTELDDARRRFEGMFHVEQSITDPASGIIVVANVRARR